ncbi:ras-GEF domain-containing family member 1B-like isoform X2 [Ptychodera flava]|uniref:ras-GEF domain-containing family member 1B-like isoform X2 n=1 Tax=Ptychodera flava TaxID=63121 RepID=UPI003969BDDC
MDGLFSCATTLWVWVIETVKSVWSFYNAVKLSENSRSICSGDAHCNMVNSDVTNENTDSDMLCETSKDQYHQPSIFGTITKDKISHKDDPKRRSLPQTSNLATMFAYHHHGREMVNGHVGINRGIVNDCEDERLIDNNALIYHDGNLYSGSVEALIQHIVPTADYYPDRTYIFAFLLCSRLFMKPCDLLREVCQLCIIQQNLHDRVIDREKFSKFGPNIVQLLSEWTETFPYDFRDERMMRHLKEITQKCASIDHSLRKGIGQLMQTLIRRLAMLEKYEEILAKVNAAAADRMHMLRANPAAFQTNIIEICPDPYVLAQQLTHIELERLTNIGPEEFVQTFIKKEMDDTKIVFQDEKKTNNLEAYVEWFNRLSYLVATEVCMHIKKKHRARLIDFFIDVAKECFNIGNFNSLMAILAGLNMSPVARLKKTWGKVNTSKFEVLENLMDPTSNFGNYRQALKAAIQRSKASIGGSDCMVIPFFSLLVKDIYFLNEGCTNKLDTGHVNFDKFWQLAKQITEFITWKQVDCPFSRDRQALNYLLTAPVFTEHSLYLASYESESPENDFEKERYKTIRGSTKKSQGEKVK